MTTTTSNAATATTATTVSDLLSTRSQHTETGLADAAIPAYLALVPGWQQDGPRIARCFEFRNYYEALAFVNAIAYVIHAEDHHPELVLTYNRCLLRFDTHTVNDGKGGISVNDFICAAKINAIFDQSFS